MINALAVPLFALGAFASLAAAQCPQVHVFGARETTAPPGFGSAGPVVDMVLSSVPGSTAEVINYPACGGQASCGGVSYAQSVIDGVNAVANQVNTFNAECPNTVLVLIGYSQVSQMGPSGSSGRLLEDTDKRRFVPQGGQIFDDAFCGGGDTNESLTNTAIPISTAAQSKIAAAIFFGDPRRIPGETFNVGTCTASGVSPGSPPIRCSIVLEADIHCPTCTVRTAASWIPMSVCQPDTVVL